MLNQIILVEKTKFIEKLLTSVLADKGVKCYCLDELQDFTYLINDLSPEVLVVDERSVGEDWDVFWQSVNSSNVNSLKLVLFSDKKAINECPYLDRFDGVIERPMDVLTIYEYLIALVEGN